MHIGFFSSITTDGYPTSGYELANEAIVDGLRALGHKVSVIGFRLPRQRDSDDVFPIAKINLENAQASGLKKAEWLVRAHLSGLPVAAAKLTMFSRDRLDRLISDRGPFDAHILNSWQMPAAFPQLLERPFGFVSHNVEHLTAAENAEQAGSVLKRNLYKREARLLEALEVELCRKATWLWALSKPDLQALPSRANAGSVLPLVVPQRELGSSNANNKTVDVGMIGTWTWQANTMGLRWFIDDVLPHLPDDMTISVAGSVPADIVSGRSRIDFAGRVESADRFLESTHAVALISRGGTGVQLKTIEAFQAGRPCVATTSSLRGVDTLPENCRTADDAERFAKELVELVDASRAGTLPTVDGELFAERQKRALLTSLNEGLTAISSQWGVD